MVGTPANLIPDPTSCNSATSITVYDSLGSPHTLTTYFIKTATSNEWDVHMLADGTSMANVEVLDPPVPYRPNHRRSHDEVVFNTNGQLLAIKVPASASNGANPEGDQSGD